MTVHRTIVTVAGCALAALALTPRHTTSNWRIHA
jgi:hypothetical protein